LLFGRTQAKMKEVISMAAEWKSERQYDEILYEIHFSILQPLI
jgi:hypothetical protein